MAEIPEGQIELQIVLDDGSVQKGFAKIKQEGKKTGEGLGRNFSSGFVKAIAAVGAAVAGGAFLRKAINEAVDAERIQKSFNLALANTGKFTQEAAREFNQYALSLAKISGVDDDLIVKNATLLTQLGRLSGTELKRATRASLDLAAALGISAEASFLLLGKASAGATESLGRYGIFIDKNIPKSEKFAEVLRLIETRFSGAAAAATNTFSGAIARLEVGFGNFIQSIGEAITKSPSVVAFVNKIAELFFDLSESIQTNKDLFRGPIEGILLFARGISFITPVIEVAINLINFYINRLIQFIFNIGNLGSALIVLASKISTAVVKIVGNVVSDIVSVFSTSAAEKIRQTTENLISKLTPSEETQEAAKGIYGGFGAELAEAFNTPLSDGLQKGIESLQNAVANAKPITDDLKNQTKEASQVAAKNTEAIAKSFETGIVNVVSAGMQRIGAALVQGGSAFNGFLGQVLNILGDLAINLGTTIVLASKAIDGLRDSLTTLFGGFGFAGGLALIALGGALKSIGGGGLVSAATGSTSPTSVASPITDTAGGIEAISQEAERQAPNTEVVVNIQGDVLDSDESGMRIVDILNTAFDKKGVSLRRGLA